MKEICSCCGERPAWPEALAHGHDLCEDCAYTTVCDDCGEGDACDEPHLIWQPGVCEKCDEKNATHEWLDDTVAAIKSQAENHGWDTQTRRAAETRSRYITCERGEEAIVVRVSDHADCYCRADYSVAMPGHESGDDCPLETVLSRLATPATTENEAL